MNWSSQQGKAAILISRITLVFAVCFSLCLHGTPPKKLGECTLALIRAENTVDGRMILWKNRDVSNSRQVVHQGGGNGYLRYIGIGYAGDGQRVYGGVNEAGFAVANSNSYNIGYGNSHGAADDGTLQTNALKTCTTLTQFRHLLNSTNTYSGGRTQPSNLLAFDSSGNASVFEAGKSVWTEVPIRESDSFAVRANYSYSGTTPTDPEWGMARHDRVLRLITNQLQQGALHFDSMFEIARDVAPEGWQNVQYNYSPSGDTISLARSICRYSTVSTMVIQGGKNTRNGWLPPVCWFFLGKPFTTIGVPVWVNQNSISSLLTDRTNLTSAICDRSLIILDSAMTNSYLIESSRLYRLRATILDNEQKIIQRTIPWLSEPITPAIAQQVSNSLASFAYATLYSIEPDAPIRAPVIPMTFTLSNPAPNPFNPVTTIQYSLAQPAQVRLSVFNALGQRIDNIGYGVQTTGNHTFQWKSSNRSSGIIWFKVTIGERVEWRKALLLK